MANMMDYLDWRGDLTFTASGFNEVDNLLFAELVYTSFDGIVTGQSEAEAVTLAEASAVFWEQNSREEILARVSMTKAAPFVLEKMAKTERFRDVKLWGYVNDISEEEQSQFAVMCAGLPDGSIYVSFRGTDNTITGWREDFNMGYLSETPGQLKAVSYVEQMLGDGSCPVRIGGHSKGGNLAVYAAVHCSSGLQDRILAVYSNDGPGFRRDIVESAAYQRVLPKIHTILPESSIVGMLFEHEEEYEVVKSSGSGAGQHDVMSWEVRGTTLVHLNHVDGKSMLVDKALKSWIGEMDEKQREVFVDALFGILDEADIRTVDDLANMNYTKFMELMKAKSSLDKETQDTMRDTFLKLVQKSAKTVAEHLLNK